MPLRDALLLHEILEDHAQDLEDALALYCKASPGAAVGPVRDGENEATIWGQMHMQGETDRHTDRHRQRETDTQETQPETDTHTDREADVPET